nr:hypothetical protein [uncultured Flavobacterium sp.]
MKKIIASIFFNLLTIATFAQVGIGTQNPERDLHLAKTVTHGGQLRVDGLNSANQSSTSSNLGVYVNKEGTVVATEEISVIYEYKSTGSNINPYFPKDTMYVKTTQEFTTKKIGPDLNFTNKAPGILFVSFQPRVSMIGNSDEIMGNSSARNFGVKIVIKDQANQIVHHVTKQTPQIYSNLNQLTDDDCLNDPNTIDPNTCIEDFYNAIDLNLNLSTTAFLESGNYKIEIYGIAFRSNDITNNEESTTIDPTTATYTVTYDHDIHSEMNVYIIHP